MENLAETLAGSDELNPPVVHDDPQVRGPREPARGDNGGVVPRIERLTHSRVPRCVTGRS
ncbi:hypothetical protein BN381_100167 [Candidatus Microthrix parvicella RN1]|uniref:Uncharacterized protein n=1 Tax=Candidatus Neomicrothrix parvicella RN1 TaxID=1229780 RepID=R4YWG0_9ACTN|nr:hypothetical protein BN381_100167 [Candidatus Microthrix parvicella RN1]